MSHKNSCFFLENPKIERLCFFGRTVIKTTSKLRCHPIIGKTTFTIKLNSNISFEETFFGF